VTAGRPIRAKVDVFSAIVGEAANTGRERDHGAGAGAQFFGHHQLLPGGAVLGGKPTEALASFVHGSTTRAPRLRRGRCARAATPLERSGHSLAELLAAATGGQAGSSAQSQRGGLAVPLGRGMTRRNGGARLSGGIALSPAARGMEEDACCWTMSEGLLRNLPRTGDSGAWSARIISQHGRRGGHGGPFLLRSVFGPEGLL